MADECDFAQIEEERHLARSLAAQAAAPRLLPTGYCRDPMCEEDVPAGQLFCGADCRDSFDLQLEVAKRASRPFP